MAKKKEKLVIKATWEDVINASVKGNPESKPKKAVPKKKIYNPKPKKKVE